MCAHYDCQIASQIGLAGVFDETSVAVVEEEEEEKKFSFVLDAVDSFESERQSTLGESTLGEYNSESVAPSVSVARRSEKKKVYVFFAKL
jgi:hypothetical protein